MSNFLFLCSQAIADTPSFIFLWVGDGVGLEQGRQCLKKVYNQAFRFFYFILKKIYNYIEV